MTVPILTPEGLLGWWSLGDYAGHGSTLSDCVDQFGVTPHNGTWLHTPGIAQSALANCPIFTDHCVDPNLDVDPCLICEECPDPNCDECLDLAPSPDDLPPASSDPRAPYLRTYNQSGWTRSGRAGGIVPYPGGSPFYDPASFTFVIFARLGSGVQNADCPGIQTDFNVPSFAPACYQYFGIDRWCDGRPIMVGDRVRSGSNLVYMAFSPDPSGETPWAFCADDTHPPPFADPNPPFNQYWRVDEEWMDCYDDFVPYHTFGLAGDHSGFPFNHGWMLYTTFAPHRPETHFFDQTKEAQNCPDCGPLRLVLYSETNGAFPPLEIFAGFPDNQWHMYAITSDGVTIKTWVDSHQVSYGPAERFSTSNSSLGFGFVDRQKALSGKDELWQGSMAQSMIWDRPLSQREQGDLFRRWCRLKHHLRTTHRAEPGTEDPAGTEDKLHLSNTRFRAEPDSSPPSAGSGFAGPHLEDIRFRSAK